jgi:N-formylmaleamate deformylase
MNYTSHTIQANGIAQHYHRTGGDKPPLVLLHGFTDNGACWLPVADTLAQDYDLIMPDFRGHGKSERIGSKGFSSEALAEDVAALIQALGLNRPAVMGHSLGAFTGLLLAATHPELVSCLLLEDPPFTTAPAQDAEEQHANRMREWADNMRRMQAQSPEELIAGERERSPRWSAAELEPWAESKHQLDLDVFVWRSAFPAWQPMLQQVQCPLLLLYGETTIVNESIVQEAASLWRNGQAVQIAHAGHCIRRDNPADFLTAVQAFLHAHYQNSYTS